MIEIKKAKIKDGMFLEAEYSERQPDGTSNSVKISSGHVIHDDLRATFNDLDEHLALFTEQYEKGKGVLGHVKMTGFTIGGSGEFEGVTLMGQRTLDRGKILNITSPFANWSDFDIEESITACREEVYKYLFEDKHQPSDQLELEFNEAGEPLNDVLEERPAGKQTKKEKAAESLQNEVNAEY